MFRLESPRPSMVAGCLVAALGAASCTKSDGKLTTVTVDWAYYNPVSIVMKNERMLEKALEADGIKVRWVLSLGSNKALELLRGGSADFASTAGAASLIGRAGGLPIQAIYVYSKPEWTALVTRPDTGIKTVEDLKGRTVAVTHGTDPHIFLLRALDAVGLSEKDIKPKLLQHPDGYRALVGKQVDAWAGLDPHMAKGELEGDTVLFHRNADLNTYGVLNVREDFAQKHPEIVKKVLATYEKARKYALAHPEAMVKSLVEAARVEPAVAKIQLGQRTDISEPRLTDAVRKTLLEAGKVLQKVGVIDEDKSVPKTLDALLAPNYLEKVGGPS